MWVPWRTGLLSYSFNWTRSGTLYHAAKTTCLILIPNPLPPSLSLSFLALQTCKERDELHSRTSSLREMIRSLESELQKSSDALTTANAEASRYVGWTLNHN